jgi:hypothetical protein
MANTISLYADGLFRTNNDIVNAAQCTALQNSGFTNIIIWALHVNAQGDLQFGDDPIVRNGVFSPQYLYMGDWINKLKAGGTVKQVFISIGGWRVGDFKNIYQVLNTPGGARLLGENFGALAAALPIDGFDFDMEEWGDNGFPDIEFITSIAQLTALIHKQCNMAVTYCPYDNEQNWLRILQMVYTNNNQEQIVSAYNLQCYSGGTGNNPSEWAETLQSNASSTGITNGAAFVIPGYACIGTSDPLNGTGCPSDIQGQFAGLSKSDPGISGGFVWKMSAILANAGSASCNGTPVTATAYATAISQGLAGLS